MTLVTATQTSAVPQTNGARMGAVMSNGLLVVLAAASNSWGLPHYWTSSDNGATWTDRGAIPSPSTSGPDGAVIPAGMTYGSIFHVSRQTISSQEKLCIWFGTGNTDSEWSAGGKSVVGYMELWYDGTNTFTSSRSGFLPSFNQPAATVGGSESAAFYDGTKWYVVAIVLTPGAPTANNLYLAAGSPGAYKPALGTAAYINWGAPGISKPDLVVTSSTMLVVLSDFWRQQTSILPCVVSGTVVTPGAVEQVSPGPGIYPASLALDGSNVDILYANSGANLAHRKRTGLNTYGAVTVIDAISTGDLVPAIIRDTGTGDLWVVYGNSTLQTNGEVKYTRLHAGIWQAPNVLAGGDASGYKHPRIWGSSASGANLTYTKGLTSTPALYYSPVSQGQAPGAPTGLTTGNVVSTTPTLGYTYVNTLSADPQGWYQYQISHDAGTTIDYDSGQLAGSGHTFAVDPGAGLVIGTGTYWRVRTWDSLSNNGSGTAGPYSSWTAILPVRGGTVTVTDIYSSGATSTTDITAPSHQVDVGWAQLDGHDADMYQELILANDGVTLLFTGTPTTLSPTIAAGGSFRTAAWNTLLTNGITVKVRMLVRDATTGLWSQSALAPYTVAYTPPAAPTGLTATLHSDTGIVTLNWTNGGAAVTTEVQEQGPDGVWVQKSSGTLISTIDLRPACLLAYAYRVRITDATSMVSAWTTITGVVLPGQGTQGLPVWITDTVTGDAVALGVLDQESNTAFDHIKDIRSFLAPGMTVRKHSINPFANYLQGQIRFKVMEANILSDGSFVHADDVIRRLQAMYDSGNTLYYRDTKGVVAYVKMLSFRAEPYSNNHRLAIFSLESAVTPATPYL